MALTRRVVMLGGAATLGAVGARVAVPQGPVMDGINVVDASGEGVMNDASLLSPTPVFKHVVLKQDPGEALVAALRTELRAATTERRPVNIGAARHSMGGQALPRNGHAVTFDNPLVEPGDGGRTGSARAHVGAM